MSWFFSHSAGAVKPDYTGLQLQTSVSSLPIPISYGQTKLAPNIVFYANFQTHAQKAGGGKGGLFGGSGITGYSYSADVIMALCEGPISGVGYIWRDQSTYTLAALGLTLYNGATPQTTWGYLATKYPSQALTYQGTAYACAANYNLGGAADLGNHNFEVIGVFAGSGVNGLDADPAQVIYDFLTNAQYGVGFSPASINLSTLYGASGDASLQTYCAAQGIAFSPLLASPEQASTTLTRWLQILNCAAVWSGGELKFMPYGDEAIASGNLVKRINSQIPVPAQKSDGSFSTPAIVVSTAANFVSDGGVVNVFTSVPLTYIGMSAPSSAGQYGVFPPGTYLFHSGDKGAPVAISVTVDQLVAYAPILSPVYDLTDLDFLEENGASDPVQAHRADPYSLPTVQRIECLSRNNQYGVTPVEARDQSQIELYGVRVGSTIQAHEICDEVGVGPVVAQTLLQRLLYVRTKYTFKLSWKYCLLDPMDIVTLTDTNLGLSHYPVRVVSVEEDEKGLLAITAEELVPGVSTPADNPSNGAIAFAPNQAAAAAIVNSPAIFEPPAFMTGNVPQVWVGASGGSGGVADPNWGGAYVWASVDDVTYSQIGTIVAPVRQGVLYTNLPASSAGWDTIDTLSVNLTESGGVLSGTSATSAQAGATLSLIDSELIAYETATLTTPNEYLVTGLERGIGGTTPAAHPAGAPFVRLDSAIVQYNLPTNWIGVTLYFKFQSFNVFGAGVQDLSTCTAYPYTPTGAGVNGPIASALTTGASLNFGDAFHVTQAESWGGAAGPISLTINLGNASP